MSNSSSTPSSLAPLDRSSWKRVRLGDVLNYEQPYPYIVKSTEYEKAGIPVLTPGKTFILGYTHETEGVCHASFESPKILFDDFLTISRLVQFDFKVKSSALKILTPVSEKFNIYFLFYAMSLLKFEVTDHQRHWIERFSKLEIQIPDKAVQDKIASSLSAVDGHLASLGELVSKYEAIKKSTVSLLLRPQPTWQKVRLGDAFTFGNGYTPSKEVKAFWENGTIPWFRMEDIRANGRILKDSIQHITPEAVKSGRLFPAGSFILSTTATLGEYALIIADSLANQRFTFLIKNVNRGFEIDTMYFLQYLAVIGEWCRKTANAGGLLAVNLNDLQNYEFALPPLSEQRRIVTALSSLDGVLASLAAEREKLASLKRGLLRHFFG